MAKVRTFVTGAVAGATVAYFTDPDRGRGRRAVARDRLMGLTRRTGAKVERSRRALRAEADGLVERTRHPLPEDLNPDDSKLKDRIESELFGNARFPKGKVNITVVDSIAELRGQLDTPDQIRAVESAVLAVPGVGDVNSMLHLPGTSAPNKREAREAG